MSSTPRIAVVGGGIAGTLCSLVLKNRGLAPTILEQSVALGGRLRGGAQFLRATSDPRLQGLMNMLQEHQVIAPWKGRFGLLGSQGGGFLPASIVQSGTNPSASGGGGVLGLTPANDGLGEDPSSSNTQSTDNGDFCHFVQAPPNTPTYVGLPDTSDVCARIADLAELPVQTRTKLLGATMASGGDEGGWILELEETTSAAKTSSVQQTKQHFDGLVVATHDPSLSAMVVQEILSAEVTAGRYSDLDEALAALKGDEASNSSTRILLQRLNRLASDLTAARASKLPLFTLRVTFPRQVADRLPFDAVTVPGSNICQFLAKESSKPSSQYHTKDQSESDTWTLVSTSALAQHVLEQGTESQLPDILVEEFASLMTPYFEGDPIPAPLHVAPAKRWGAALTGQGLGLQEDSIILSGWRMGICGDFLRTNDATPWEAAALSGLDAGERMALALSRSTD